jgi:hypothetical protein
VSLRPTFVAFTPWTTLDDYLNLCRFIRDHGWRRRSIPSSSRCAAGAARVGAAGGARHRAVSGAAGREALSYRWTHPDPRMDRLERTSRRSSRRPSGDGRAARGDVLAHPPLAARPPAYPTKPPAAARLGLGPRRVPPHLTEAWFCCAQPTRRQLDAF